MNWNISAKFDRLSEKTANYIGKPVSFVLASLTILLWGFCGPFTHYSDTWQLVVNTGTTVLTFLMLFILQNTKNRGAEENRQQLSDIQKNQKAMLNLDRKMAERMRAIELQLDKLDKPIKNKL